ncbi:MAG: tol-pal system protein YbgF [Desulfovibrionaceae bacterium]|nr:tol-pal system protein YbgF [Desulfovibrionaceae bacterium]
MLCICICALIAPAGCASKKDVESIQYQTHRDRQESRKLFKQLEEDLVQTQDKLKQEIEKSKAPVQQKQANIWAEMENLRLQVAKIQGELEAVKMRLAERSRAQNATMTMQEAGERIKAMELVLEHQFDVDLKAARQKAAAGPAAPAVEQPEQGPEPDASAEQPQDPAKALYDKAYARFKQGKYDDARRFWAEFVKAFPQNDLTPNALFWQGECFYQSGEYGKAVLTYQEVIEKHPKSSKYRPALLKQGIAFYRMGKNKPGQVILQKLIDGFPSSAEAARAKKFIEEN